jgi:3-hydroxybutyryl-CoA dehydrogenase
VSDLPSSVGLLGAGRMGRGIALSFALAGTKSILIDLKERSAEDSAVMAAAIRAEMEADLGFLAEVGLFDPQHVSRIADRISLVSAADAAASAGGIPLFFEGVPEVLPAKQACLEWASRHAGPDAVIASTTSTILVDDLAGYVTHPERFVNAHWLNPAHLMPLVEVSHGNSTSAATTERLVAWLEAAGKVPVRMKASPGYIVPRIQALAMNEAARMVEEGVATAEDIDKAVKVGFGLRFAVLGLAEFIDWGGGDILYYADKYLSRTLDKDRFRTPQIIEDNMHNQRNGLRDGVGFYDYRDMDVAAYRKSRMADFIGLLKYLELAPKPDVSTS